MMPRLRADRARPSHPAGPARPGARTARWARPRRARTAGPARARPTTRPGLPRTPRLGPRRASPRAGPYGGADREEGGGGRAL